MVGPAGDPGAAGRRRDSHRHGAWFCPWADQSRDRTGPGNLGADRRQSRAAHSQQAWRQLARPDCRLGSLAWAVYPAQRVAQPNVCLTGISRKLPQGFPCMSIPLDGLPMSIEVLKKEAEASAQDTI